MTQRGIFPDVIGLSYRSSSSGGVTGSDFAFEYDTDAEVVFAIGSLQVGKLIGKEIVKIHDLVPRGTSDFDARLINRARLLYSLTPGQGFEKPIVINENVRNVIEQFASRIDLESTDISALDGPLSGICTQLGIKPKSVSHTRNHLRREGEGFKVLRDLEIPSQDGRVILGDVYLPVAYQLGKKYPVLVSCSLYGRRVFHSGPDLHDPAEIDAFEEAEDTWHSKSSKVALDIPRGSWGDSWNRQRGFESIAAFNASSYVPHGYAMLKVDPAGVSQTPGSRGVPGQMAQDFHAAIEWATSQSWSDGNIGMVGSSYGANAQWAVASMRPKGLKCFVPYATDIDSYRDAAYTGGIPAGRYIRDWFSRVKNSSPKWGDFMDLAQAMTSHPFYDPLWKAISSSTDQREIPCFLAASQIFIIHGRGAYEVWRDRSPDNTHLQLVDCNYYPWPSRQASGKILQFLGRHLKGHETVLEPVGIQMRLGWKEWYWRKETDWPVPGTKYTKWHLGVDGFLSSEPPKAPETVMTYSTKVTSKSSRSGLSFYSQPFEEDVEFAGHFSAALTISSTAADADVTVTLWAVDCQGVVVPYGSSDRLEPIAKGFLRASHRKLDPSKSRPERPWHTHAEEDSAPLNGGQIVQLEVEILPAAARIRAGWRLRVDVTPSELQPELKGYEPPDMRDWYGESHDEACDALHIGGSHVNYVLCPVVPVKEGYPNIVM